MKQDVNYVKHHKAANLKLIELKLSSSHVSLYNALFLIWNESSFDTELSVNRNDVMMLSRIGSANTYTKCLKELDDAKLIKYKPSFNPLIGSTINLYRFDKGSDKGCVNSSSKGTDKGSGVGCDNGCDTLYKLLNSETIKLLNNNSEIVNLHLESWIFETENNEPEPTKKKQPKQPKIQKHIFADSVFHENETYFETEWMKTESFKSNPLLSIKKIFNTLRLSDEKYKYVNWIKAAENWVLRNPSQYHVSVKDLVQADPMAAFMNKGELQSAESTLKRQIKRTLLNGNQPNTDEDERELPFD